MGTFIERLKPWLARELKLKRPQRLTEAIRMAEILEDSYYSEKKPFKESSGSKNFKSESNKDSWKGKGVIEDSSKKESKDVKKTNKGRGSRENQKGPVLPMRGEMEQGPSVPDWEGIYDH